MSTTKSKSPSSETLPDNDLMNLFQHQLKDTYFAETAIIKALPKMAKAAHSSELRHAFETHLKQTEGHVKRLDEVFALLGQRAEGVPCEAIKGIIKEGEEGIEDFTGTSALDASLAASAQAVEHYEISRYGTLKAWADELGMKDASKLFDATLKEEIATDVLLTKLSSKTLVPEAA